MKPELFGLETEEELRASIGRAVEQSNEDQRVMMRKAEIKRILDTTTSADECLTALAEYVGKEHNLGYYKGWAKGLKDKTRQKRRGSKYD